MLPTASRTTCEPSPGDLDDLGDARAAALGDDVGGAEFPAEVGAGRVPAHQDDRLCAELFAGQDGGESDGAVADDGHGLAWADVALAGSVVAGEVDVGQGQ